MSTISSLECSQLREEKNRLPQGIELLRIFMYSNKYFTSPCWFPQTVCLFCCAIGAFINNKKLISFWLQRV